MARYTITLTVDGAQVKSVEKKLKAAFGEEQPITSAVEKVKTAESRADRLAEAESMADQARAMVKDLYDEMDQWYDSIPENLKEGSKAQEVDECKTALEELKDALEGLDFSSVSFPGMY